MRKRMAFSLNTCRIGTKQGTMSKGKVKLTQSELSGLEIRMLEMSMPNGGGGAFSQAGHRSCRNNQLRRQHWQNI